MQVQRCPECGIRLKTAYCDICMKRVPFKGMPAKQTFQHYEGSSAHRMEAGHECVSFEREEKKTFRMPVKRKSASGTKKSATLVAVILAILSLLPSLFSIAQDMSGAEVMPEPEPVTSYHGSIPAVESREIYNADGVSVVVDYADFYYDDYTVFMTVVNESDIDVVVATDLLSVNGYMHQSSFYAEVDAGSAVQESLQLSSWQMERDGIEEVAQIAFHLNIYPDDFSEMTQSELITLETDAADTYEQPLFLDGWELYADRDVELRLVSYGDNGGNYELQFYAENLSENTVSISTSAIRINGEETDGILWDTLRADTCSHSEVYLSIPGVNESSQIEEITLELHIEYMEGWYVEETVDETVTFYPNAHSI